RDARRTIDEPANRAVRITVAEEVALGAVLERGREAVADEKATWKCVVVPSVDPRGPVPRGVPDELSERVVPVRDPTRPLDHLPGMPELVVRDGDASPVGADLLRDATAGIVHPPRRRPAGQRLRGHV